jgi:hypothetical protein
MLLLEILRRTPSWVWLVLGLLLALGLNQLRPRQVAPRWVLVMPLALLGLGLVALLPGFRGWPVGGLLWALALAAGLVLGRRLPHGQARFEPATQRLHLPGSAWPLGLMLGIFLLRYASAVAQALQPAWRSSVPVQASLALVLGLLSGLFLGRALGLWRLSRGFAAAGSPA